MRDLNTARMICMNCRNPMTRCTCMDRDDALAKIKAEHDAEARKAREPKWESK